DPSFHGQGLISNNYSAPFGSLAGTWAYIQTDPRAVVVLSQPFQTGDYVWLADRRSNPDYLRPNIYVCFNSWSNAYELVAEVLARQTGSPGCSNNPIVQRAQSGTDRTPPSVSVLARDTESAYWAILRLEWPSSR